MPNCLTCGKPFPDYQSLALHIVQNKKTHRKGLTWARKYLSRQQSLDRKVSNQVKRENRTPLTEQDLENRRNNYREISGKVAVTEVICPQCKTKAKEWLPVEYINDADNWKLNGLIALVCHRCGRE